MGCCPCLYNNMYSAGIEQDKNKRKGRNVTVFFGQFSRFLYSREGGGLSDHLPFHVTVVGFQANTVHKIRSEFPCDGKFEKPTVKKAATHLTNDLYFYMIPYGLAVRPEILLDQNYLFSSHSGS